MDENPFVMELGWSQSRPRPMSRRHFAIPEAARASPLLCPLYRVLCSVCNLFRGSESHKALFITKLVIAIQKVCLDTAEAVIL